MTFHLAGWYENLDAAAAFNALTALTDQRLATNGDRLRVPMANKIIWAAAGADGVVDPRIRLTSPSLIRNGRPEITPVNVTNAAAVEPSSPHAIMDLRGNPIVLDVDEDLSAELNNNPAAAQDQWCLVALAEEVPSPIEGATIITARATVTATLVAGAWTIGQITFDDALAVGNYMVVGMRASAPGLVAARLVFRDNADYRPGCLGTDATADLAWPAFRAGNLGDWGRFHTNQPPAVEFLSVSADTAEVVHLDLVRVG